MAFVDALYEGIAELDGVLAKRARKLSDLAKMLRCGRAVPVVEAPLENVIAEVHPDVLIDARMRKRKQPEPQRDLAPLVIGLGPNFEVGVNADIAIETKWGDELGAVLWSGRTQNLAGEPQEIAGHARDRYVYAPANGVFSTSLNVGDMVVAGQEVARIENAVICAPLSGCLRGLAHDGALVKHGAKVLEVDPRGAPASVRGVGERPRRIAEGVLKALSAKNVRPGYGVGRPFAVGALIATLGGLIGLGGAEFRLPALVRFFRFDVREAIAINVLVSLVTVAAALAFRGGFQGATLFLAHLNGFVALVLGSLIGAYAGSGLVARLDTHKLHRMVGGLLIALAVVMATHGFMPHSETQITQNAVLLFVLGSVCGVGIGMVGSMLGVAGGELLIPAWVLIYGADIKTAGTLALSVSLPMLLVTVWRMRNLPSARAAAGRPRFITAMAIGSLLGAFIGSRLVGVAPEQTLSLVLAVILLISAVKTFGK
jgi:xanthine dehydrogenase accessory factor